MEKPRTERRAEHFLVGEEGERVAGLYLQSIGYEIRGRNVRVGRRDEIDLIAFDARDQVLVFAEVKARRVNNAEFPAELNAGRRKRRALLRGMRRWIQAHHYDGYCRMDLICVEGGTVTKHWRQIGEGF